MLPDIFKELAMHIDELRDYCLAKKGVSESLPFDEDTLVFKVLDKAFLLTSLVGRPLAFNVKCEPEFAITLREQHDCVKPGYHMNKKHWNTITVDGSVSDKLLKYWIDHSYECVVNGFTRKKKVELAAL